MSHVSMFCSVIPAIRTPRNVGAFDYAVPEGISIRIGDLVRIPFRKSEIVGIVSELKATCDVKDPKKIIGSFFDLHLGEITIALIQQLSERSFTSQPSVLHAWLGKLPKKQKREATSEKRDYTSEVTPLAPPCPVANAKGYRFLLNHQDNIVSTAKEALDEGKKVLILSPWASRAERIARTLETHALTSDIAPGKRFTLWSNFLLGSSPILISTRIGAWCGIGADLIIIDEPENDDHKQDELSPRYDARWIAAYLQSKQINTVSIGLTPKLTHVFQSSLSDIPTIQGDIQYIDTHYADWSDIPGIQGRTSLILEDAARQQRPIFIIHPIYGDQARLRCKDCGWMASCDRCGASMIVQKGQLYCRRCQYKKDAALECPSCGSVQFANSKPGTIKIAEAIKKLNIPETRVLSINEWNMVETIPDHSLVILTDLNLLSGAREDLRKTEQLIIAWRRLADICDTHQSTLVVQSDPATIAYAKEWLDGDACIKALQKEIEDRRMFKLPPTTRLIKFIFRGNQGHAIRILDILRQEVRGINGMDISGPFEVRFRPTHREPRWIGQLLAPIDTPLQDIIRILQPIAQQTDTLIDLDPIAYFE